MPEETPSQSINSIPAIAQARYFRLALRGQVGEFWVAAFHPVSFSSSPGGTVLEVQADQAALRGIMNRLWDLNLDILAMVEISEPAVRNGVKGNE